jgi:SAM-dependent methyltransferase
VLDLGCGYGLGTACVAEEAELVVGVDMDERVLVDGAGRSRRAAFVRVDGRSLPFRDGSFDSVVASHVLEHVSEAERPTFLHEIGRVLGPGRVCVFITPNRNMRVSPGQEVWSPFHEVEFSAGTLAGAVSKIFRKVAVLGVFAELGVYEVLRRRGEYGRFVSNYYLPVRSLLIRLVRALAGEPLHVLRRTKRRLLSLTGVGWFSGEARLERRAAALTDVSPGSFYVREDLSGEPLDLIAVCEV